jgi:hypothetical protein
VAKLLEDRDRIGTAKESICKERIYLSHREYKGEHMHPPTSRGNGMLNRRESMTQVVVVVDGITVLVMPVVRARELNPPSIHFRFCSLQLSSASSGPPVAIIFIITGLL